MAAKQALYILASGLVLDRSVFAAQNSTDMQATLVGLRIHSHKPFKVIDNANSFFNADNLLTAIKVGNGDYHLIAQQAGVNLSPADVLAIQTAEKVSAEIATKMKPKYVYPFADVPEGWTFADDVSFGPTKVRRKRNNPIGDGTQYALTPDRIEALWLHCSKVWAKVLGASTNAGLVTSDGQRRAATVMVDRVTIGCQTIRRYELEQIAKHKGWAFPAA